MMQEWLETKSRPTGGASSGGLGGARQAPACGNGAKAPWVGLAAGLDDRADDHAEDKPDQRRDNVTVPVRPPLPGGSDVTPVTELCGHSKTSYCQQGGTRRRGQHPKLCVRRTVSR